MRKQIDFFLLRKQRWRKKRRKKKCTLEMQFLDKMCVFVCLQMLREVIGNKSNWEICCIKKEEGEFFFGGGERNIFLFRLIGLFFVVQLEIALKSNVDFMLQLLGVCVGWVGVCVLSYLLCYWTQFFFSFQICLIFALVFGCHWLKSCVYECVFSFNCSTQISSKHFTEPSETQKDFFLFCFVLWSNPNVSRICASIIESVCMHFSE